MAEVAFFGLALGRYGYRVLKKPVSSFVDFFRSVDSETERVGAKANFLVYMLSKAYEYHLRDQNCIRKWLLFGYEIIPAAEFNDGNVRDLLESCRRVLIPLRRSRNQPRRGAGVHPGENRYDVLVLFRGTSFDPWDILEDFAIPLEDLHETERVQRSDALVRELVERYGYENVCLVGHSLGAVVAFLIARKFYLDRRQTLEGHFFNLPFMCVGALIQEMLSLMSLEYVFLCQVVNLLSLRPVLNGLLGEAQRRISRLPHLRDSAHQAAAEFSQLTGWKPNIYVNEYDRISRSYITYFRGMRSEGGPNVVGRSGWSRATAILKTMGIDARAHHLCPSAKLIISKKGISTLINSHSLRAWEDRKHYHLRIESYVRN